MSSYDPVAITGLTRDQVIEGLRKYFIPSYNGEEVAGAIHPDSRIVAAHNISGVDIANMRIIPEPCFALGALRDISDEEIAVLESET